jgi:hypothetical protein
MKILKFILLAELILQGCISQFLPEVQDFKDYIVVDALVTDQNNSYKVNISRTSKLGNSFNKIPVSGCLVTITDDQENLFQLFETESGLYLTDSLSFRGQVGRKYTLHIKTDGHQYESFPMEMKPVPLIDSLYAEIIDNNSYQLGKTVRGYQVYFDTHDPSNSCKFFRWDFQETWEFHLPYLFETIVNTTCWKSAPSKKIYIENTSSLTEDIVNKFPLNFITSETDRLTRKYSLLVRQFSLNEDEYNYWDKLKRITEEVGGLYDVIPMSIESNIYCTDSPVEKVLGYFSVSSVASKRIFIKNTLTGFPDFYKTCPFDTVNVGVPIPNLNTYLFILTMIRIGNGPFQYVLTMNKECVDCTLNGTNKMPDFWNTTKNDVVIENAIK